MVAEGSAESSPQALPPAHRLTRRGSGLADRVGPQTSSQEVIPDRLALLGQRGEQTRGHRLEYRRKPQQVVPPTFFVQLPLTRRAKKKLSL